MPLFLRQPASRPAGGEIAERVARAVLCLSMVNERLWKNQTVPGLARDLLLYALRLYPSMTTCAYLCVHIHAWHQISGGSTPSSAWIRSVIGSYRSGREHGAGAVGN